LALCGTLEGWDSSRLRLRRTRVALHQALGRLSQQDRGKSYISVADVDALAESPRRLPARFANKLYRSGESGMGRTIFTVVFADGSRQAYGAGNAVDFIRYPEGKTSSDVVDVLPHEGRTAEPVSSPEYYWCLLAA
jgi:hypothetical protein